MTTLLGATSAFVMMAILGMVSLTVQVSVHRMSLLLVFTLLIVSDVNECEIGSDNCDENAECTDTTGSFNCSCNFGYSGNGTFCC